MVNDESDLLAKRKANEPSTSDEVLNFIASERITNIFYHRFWIHQESEFEKVLCDRRIKRVKMNDAKSVSSRPEQVKLI